MKERAKGFTEELREEKSSEGDLEDHDPSQVAGQVQFQDAYRRLPS